MKKNVYETPTVEVVEIIVEQSVFSLSNQDFTLDDSWDWGN